MMMQALVHVFGQIKMSSVNKVYTAVEKTWISFGFHFAYYVCVSLSGGVIREDSPYSIAAVPTSAARCPRCRRYTAESAECLCPRCQTIVSQGHWQAKVSPWQLANITLDGFVSLLLVKLHLTAESRPVFTIPVFNPWEMYTWLQVSSRFTPVYSYFGHCELNLQLSTL